ncbi:IQ domain-containing protein H isoform X2 [Pantherophis guttatus]|uniref:IQ domain-containing protein H isoform X2 n=1 Tax=Pantherophis guttatus TaxID=94885 RepID=A0A6P9D5N5_PANGU|nr:IQ domain-containing protein H isoform X2 [Pantherophis guttatus]
MAGVAGPGVELGCVLVQVQEDLQQLKEQLRGFSHDWETADTDVLESVVEKAENRLRKHAENYLNAVNRSVLTIFPADDAKPSSRQISKWGIPLEPPQKEISFPKMPVMAPPGSAALPPASSLGSKHKLSMMMKILCDPKHIYHRSIVNQNYGVSLPLVNRRKTACAPTQKIAKGVTVSNLSIAPPASYFSNIRSAVPISEKDAGKGILNLIERGLIPRAARITLEKPPILPKPVPLHEFQTKYKKVDAEGARQSEKVEAAPLPSQKPTQVSEHPAEGGKEKKGTKGSIAPPPSCISVISSKKLKQQQLLQAMRLRESAASSVCLAKTPEAIPPETFKKVAFEFEIPVCKGVLDYAASDLVQFKQYCCLLWGSVFSFLQQVEVLMKEYAIPLAIVMGKKVMDLVPDFELNQRATREEILSVLKNVSTVQKFLKQPGRRYKGQNGTEKAAIKIQATWKCYKLRKSYIGFRHRQWASGIIAISWLIHVHLQRVRKTLKESRQKHLENFHLRTKHLAANWNRIRSSRRTIIHIPSLGYKQSLREADPDFAVHQGSQFGRLCEIKDPNVDVIYICPLELSEELLRYYNKLLGLQPAVRSGNPEDIGDLQDRFKILTPEAINSFPNRPMSLASFLKYSPKILKRVRNLVQGKEAYIVGGLLNQDDLEVADVLDLPILGSDPEVAHLYSTKSGNKRVFDAAGVPVPPGQYDIYSRHQMIEALSQLIIDNPEVQRWVFKMDNEFGGNGTAFCDIAKHLKCYAWILKEHHRYGPEMWNKRWAHEPALVKLSQELPGLLAQHAQAVNEKRFPTWGKFLQTFVSQGGVVEAFPPSDSITSLTVDMLIEPTGEVTMVSCGDQFHAEGPLRSSGTTLPQASVEPKRLHLLCSKIGEACKSRGVVGYFSIDFVTFIHPQSLRQQVWATDLDLRYSDHLAMTRVALYVTEGTFDCASSRFQVHLPSKKPPVQKEQTRSTSLVSRYVLMSSSIKNDNLSLIYYNVFLQMCKAHGIGYDVRLKEGTVFILFEDKKRNTFGMITIGEHLQGVLMTFAQHLFIIYQELSAPNMHAETNFKGAIQDIERILGVTEQNKLKFEEKKEASKAKTSKK